MLPPTDEQADPHQGDRGERKPTGKTGPRGTRVRNLIILESTGLLPTEGACLWVGWGVVGIPARKLRSHGSSKVATPN